MTDELPQDASTMPTDGTTDRASAPLKHRRARAHERAPVLTLCVVMEGGLGAVAILIAYLASFSLLGQFPKTGEDWIAGILIGVAVSLPPLLFLAITGRVRWRPLRRVSWIIDRFLVPMFRGRSLATLLFIAIMAGVGEELFFRGLVQEGTASLIGGILGVILGLTLGSALFGLAHPFTIGYLVYATVMGVYLGLALIVTDNLLVPVIAHACYDFVALIYYVRIRHRRRSRKSLV